MNTYSSPVKVAIAGATGYAGQELVALLARHPHLKLIAAMSSSADSAERRYRAILAEYPDERQGRAAQHRAAGARG